MPTRIAFLSRCFAVLKILLCIIFVFFFFGFLAGSAGALPPGGGVGGGFGGGHGFGGGGHFGGHSGGKSGSSKPGGHFGWLHLGGHSKASASSFQNSSPFWSSLWSSIGFTRSFSAPPTMMLNRPVASGRYDGRNSFPTWRGGGNHGYHFGKYPFGRYPSSGCFFNGTTQVCYFVPLLPFWGFAGGFYFDGGFDGAWIDSGDGGGDTSDELGQREMDAIAPTNDQSGYGSGGIDVSADADKSDSNSAVGKDQFMLVLKNRTEYAVSDYWVADGYLEYRISDGTRSQVPLESLDLEATVARNAARGLPFVLRAAPGH